MQFKPHPSCFCVVIGEGLPHTHRSTEPLVGAGEMELYLLFVFNKHAPELGLFTSDISGATSIFTRSHVQPSTASVKLGRKQYRKEKQEVESVSHRLYPPSLPTPSIPPPLPRLSIHSPLALFCRPRSKLLTY